MKAIYLDHAATTPIDPAVITVMQPYLSDLFYNPSAQYSVARAVKKDLDAARAGIAHYIGCRPAELIFTAGGTEANNLAIKGVMDQFPGSRLLVSAIEHDSVLSPAKKYDAKIIPVVSDGRIDLEALGGSVDDTTVLISIQYANNEIGTIQPLKDIAELITTVRKDRQSRGVELPLYFHTDACQASAYLDIHASRLGIDLMTINASKIYGPKQIGALYIRSGTQLTPQILGGGQEKGYRSGTENVPAIIGFAKALQLVQDRRHDESERVKTLQQKIIAELAQKLPQITINGSLKNRLVNNVHITVPGYDNETLMMQLDEMGIMCAVGSACSASNDEPSHVLQAIGLTETEAQSSLRFTFGLSTTTDDISHVVDALTQLIG